MNTPANTPKAEAPAETVVEADKLEPYEVTLVMPGAPLKDHDLVIGEMNKITKREN